MRKTKQAVRPIDRIDAVLGEIQAAVADGNRFPSDVAPLLARLSEDAVTLALPRYASHVKPLGLLRAAVESGDRRAAERHVVHVRRTLSPSPNDEPFAIGAPVSLARSRHGWHDHGVEGRVTKRHQDGNGTWSYEVRDGSGETFEVERTRDMAPGR